MPEGSAAVGLGASAGSKSGEARAQIVAGQELAEGVVGIAQRAGILVTSDQDL